MMITRPDPNLIVRIASGTIVFVGIFGFYLATFFESGFSRAVGMRGAWLLVLLVIPVLSAFVYLFVTRSQTYRECLARRVQTTPRVQGT